MIRKIFLPIFFTVLFSGIAIGDIFNGTTHLHDRNYQVITINGPANLEKVKASSLIVNGPLQFSDISVESSAEIHGPVVNSKNGVFKDLKIIGPINGEKIICESLVVMGPVIISDLEVKEKMQVIGMMNVKRASIKDLEVTSDKINLTDSKIRNIIVNKNNDKVQKLILDRIIVSGDISFESGKGMIELSRDSKIAGKITGAIVANKK